MKELIIATVASIGLLMAASLTHADMSHCNTLNKEQIKILALLSVGTAEEEIAEQLRISTQAVRIEINSIFKKINAPNLFQAVLWAASRL